MPKVLVAGLINIETTLKVDSFPIPYFPVTAPLFGIQTTVSGVGYNLAKAFQTLGNPVDFLSMIGTDEELNAQLVRSVLAKEHIAGDLVLNRLSQTPQSVILYDPSGKREIYSDLKDIIETEYPIEDFRNAIKEAELLALCSINFARPILDEARCSGKLIATDVHVLRDPYDEYNADYMRAADILFLSDEGLPSPPEKFIQTLYDIYHNKIIVIGLGAKGALLYEGRKRFMALVPAVDTRPVISTIGAGDALFTSFCHCYLKSGDSLNALRRAVVFASYKIGVAAASEGYLTDEELEEWVKKVYQ
ncbi:MAG: carbohydrate kinase family protein [Anaerolineaceae bacterium]|nr:carbohydrate kinase family protein [Anaerolineaceae bacterium]